MKPLVYVAGPMTSDPYGCVGKACEAFDELRDLGLVPFLPQLSVLAEMVSPRDYEDWLAYDLDVIYNCAAVVRLPGLSPGADRECEYARFIGLPVFCLPGDDAALREWAAFDPPRRTVREP